MEVSSLPDTFGPFVSHQKIQREVEEERREERRTRIKLMM
jgi:hypothetical protein